MQELYGRHFLAPFGSFDAIPDQDQPAIDPHRAWPQHARAVGAAVTTVAPLLPVRGGYPRSYFGATQP
jgi:hypothetical protein